jgi:hypothetical protein
MVIVEKLVEWRLAGETEVFGENLPQSHFVRHQSHMTRPGFELGPPRWEASYGAAFNTCIRDVSRSILSRAMGYLRWGLLMAWKTERVEFLQEAVEVALK